MRLCTEPAELVAAVGDDVVGVDAVEAGLRRSSHEAGLRIELDAAGVQRPPRRRPVCDRQVERPIDVERRDPVVAQIGDVGQRARRRYDRRTARDAPRPRCRRPRRDDHRRQPLILGRPLPPPRDDDLVDARRPDLIHLLCQHDLIRGGVETDRRVVRRCDVVRRVVPELTPVQIGAVVRRGAVPRIEEGGDAAACLCRRGQAKSKQGCRGEVAACETVEVKHLSQPPRRQWAGRLIPGASGAHRQGARIRVSTDAAARFSWDDRSDGPAVPHTRGEA